MLLWFYSEDSNDDLDFLAWLPDSYTPLIVWTCFFGYIFFPSYSVFNGEGRKYLFNLLYLCLFSLFYPMEFRISWATD